LLEIWCDAAAMRLAIAMVGLLAASAEAETLPTGNVLVWADAPLYSDPNDSGPGVRVATLDLGRDKDVGYVYPMKVIGGTGEFLEVEPTADVECAWWRVVKPDGLDTVHLYVKRADLAPVLVKPFKASHKDGTSISVQAGVPVLAGKIAFNRGVVPVAIPEASLGLAYAPHKIAAVAKPGKTKFLLDEATEVTLGDASFSLGPWVAAAAKPKKQRMHVSIAARCMTAVVSAPKDRVHAGVSINQAVDAKAAPPRPVTSSTYYLPAGTKMMSERGDHVVGTLDADRPVVKPKSGASRACSDFVITRDDPFVDVPHTVDTSQPQRTLKLCAAADALKTK
jgi:hypothetical protein